MAIVNAVKIPTINVMYGIYETMGCVNMAMKTNVVGKITPVYNFINDSHFAGQGISGFSQEQMILLCFRPFSRKWQKIPPAEFSR